MIWVLLTHFESFYRNPETVSIAGKWVDTDRIENRFFIEIQRQGIILAPMCLCLGKNVKTKGKECFSYNFPRWFAVFLIAQSLKTHQQ